MEKTTMCLIFLSYAAMAPVSTIETVDPSNVYKNLSPDFIGTYRIEDITYEKNGETRTEPFIIVPCHQPYNKKINFAYPASNEKTWISYFKNFYNQTKALGVVPLAADNPEVDQDSFFKDQEKGIFGVLIDKRSFSETEISEENLPHCDDDNYLHFFSSGKF